MGSNNSSSYVDAGGSESTYQSSSRKCRISDRSYIKIKGDEMFRERGRELTFTRNSMKEKKHEFFPNQKYQKRYSIQGFLYPTNLLPLDMDIDTSPTRFPTDGLEDAPLQNQEQVSIDFTWNFHGEKVYLIGNFTNWSEQIQMIKSPHSSQSSHYVSMKLLQGQRYYFKYIVDGEWRFSPEQPTCSDENGNINNYIDVPHPPVEEDNEIDGVEQEEESHEVEEIIESSVESSPKQMQQTTWRKLLDPQKDPHAPNKYSQDIPVVDTEIQTLSNIGTHLQFNVMNGRENIKLSNENYSQKRKSTQDLFQSFSMQNDAYQPWEKLPTLSHTILGYGASKKGQSANGDEKKACQVTSTSRRMWRNKHQTVVYYKPR